MKNNCILENESANDLHSVCNLENLNMTGCLLGDDGLLSILNAIENNSFIF